MLIAERYGVAIASSCFMARSTLRKPLASSSPFDLVDLPAAAIDEIVIVLHDRFHLFLIALAATSTRLHHLLELIESLHLHLGHDRPVLLGAEVGHDPHLRHAALRAELVHLQELLDH